MLESGTADDNLYMFIPSLYSKLFGSEVDWNFYSTPQANQNESVINFPQGKSLGGNLVY